MCVRGPAYHRCVAGDGQAAKKSVFKVLDRVSAIDPFDEDGIKPTEVHGRIEFVNVSFRWVFAPPPVLCVPTVMSTTHRGYLFLVALRGAFAVWLAATSRC